MVASQRSRSASLATAAASSAEKKEAMTCEAPTGDDDDDDDDDDEEEASDEPSAFVLTSAGAVPCALSDVAAADAVAVAYAGSASVAQ